MSEQTLVDVHKNEVMTPEVFRRRIVLFQNELCKSKKVLSDDAAIEAVCPLKHSFAEGLYIRQITVPAGVLTVTKIHKYSHVAFLLKGKMRILEESGVKYIEAPAYFITAAGTKRIIYHETEVVLVTVHATTETDVDKIEEAIIAKTYADLTNTG